MQAIVDGFLFSLGCLGGLLGIGLLTCGLMAYASRPRAVPKRAPEPQVTPPRRSPLWCLTPEEAEDIIAIAYEAQAGKRGGPNDGAPQEAA